MTGSTLVSLLLGTVLGLYLVASAGLFVFGVNLTWFSVLSWRNRSPTSPSPPLPRHLPVVTVQLPIYNERFVAQRLIEAACAIEYPAHLLQIQVLDDSTDDTTSIVTEAVASACAAGIDIAHVRRDDRAGFKAGALQAGLGQARGSLIAMFDADFVPPSDFLMRTVPHLNDPSIGFVQARWGHLNPTQSWLTRIQAPAIDGHFLVEQQARGIRGYWFNFNGTAGLWRRAAIDDAGGWQSDTLTEDLDLSYRAHLRNWRGVYLPDLVVPGELPAEVAGFRGQQHRWARGSLECARKLLKPIWRSPASFTTKLQASIHLLAYSVHLLLAALVVAYPFVVVALDRFHIVGSWYGIGYLLGLASLAPALFLGTGQALLLTADTGPDRSINLRSLVRRLPAVGGLVLFGSGLMVNTARAALQIRTRPQAPFERTAKFGYHTETRPLPPALETSQGPAPTTTYHGRLDPIVGAELVLAAYAAASATFAYSHHSCGIVV